MSSKQEWTDDGWTQYQKLVLAELERLSESQQRMNSEIHELKIEIAMLNVKSGVWGIIGGAIPVAIAVLLGLLKAKA